MSVLPTPFHPRTADYNLSNAWVTRAGFTLPAYYTGAQEEALAARFSAVLMDATQGERLRVHGAGAAALLTAACGFDMAEMAPGEARPAAWRSKGGGVRGFGAVVRHGESNFVVHAEDANAAWFEAAAPRFDAQVRDETAEKGVILLAGPAAADILAAAGLAAKLQPYRYAVLSWLGLSVGVGRIGALARHLGGVEILCTAEDAALVFDRLLSAGRAFGLTMAGEAASDLLHLECGVPRAGIDFTPAREASEAGPSLAEIGLAAAEGGAPVLAGLVWETETPQAFAPLFHNGQQVGRSLSAAYSPSLRRAIALAHLPAKLVPGTAVQARSLTRGAFTESTARVTKLPFI